MGDVMGVVGCDWMGMTIRQQQQQPIRGRDVELNSDWFEVKCWEELEGGGDVTISQRG